VKLLLSSGADPRIKDDEDKTALLNAVSGNFGDVAFALVEQGADPNDVFFDDEQKPHNLLWDSIVVENTKFAALLVAKGADLSHKDEHNVTVLIQAAHKGQTDVVVALVERQSEMDVSAANDEGITALIAAASEGHAAIVSSLLAGTSAAVNTRDKDGTTAVMAAAVRGHKDVVEVLVSKGADVNAQNMDGHTALMFAYNGRNQVASLLDKYSEYVTKDAESNDNSTLIIQKALETHTSIVDLLVRHGADVSLKDNKGNVAVDFDYKPKAADSVELNIEGTSKNEL
jgi:ankyrin repeat protein